MARIPTPEIGTLVIAALLLLVLGFTGHWIFLYADPDTTERPWVLVRWLLAGAAAIIGIALLMYMRTWRRGG